MVLTREKVIVVLLILFCQAYFLWQFDHTAAQPFWRDPLMHQKVIDGWFLGYLSGIDVYNTCIAFTMFFLVTMAVVAVCDFGTLQIQGQPSAGIPKEALIGVLISIETFVVPLQTKLALTGQMPNRVDTLSMVLTAVLVAVTYFLKYLGYKKS